MRKNPVKAAFFAILLLAAPACAETAAETKTLPLAMSAFAQSYAAALHANSAARLEALTDPKSVACILKVSPVWFDQEAYTYAHADIAAEPTVSLTDFSLPIPDGVVFPDKPEKLLVLTWKTGIDMKGKDAIAQLGIIENAQGIFRTLPCPTVDAIKMRDAYFQRRGYKSPAP